MYFHWVLFEIKKHHVGKFSADCRLWAAAAKKQRGFVDCRPLYRTNAPDHYAALFVWKNESAHNAFMSRHHDRLVSLSKCPVKVLGYFNFESSLQKARRAVGEFWRGSKRAC